MTDEPPVVDLIEEDVEPAYTTDFGAMYEGDSRQLLDDLDEESVDLVLTSPPFALQHTKEYGNKDQGGYKDWFSQFAERVYDVLQPHGSFVVEIGGAFKKGVPERSTYQFDLLTHLVDELGFHLAQDFYWYNPAKLPNPTEWVNVRKIRVTDAVTHIWWLSKGINSDSAVESDEAPVPEANNQRSLTPYSDDQETLIKTGEYNDGDRPSGRTVGESSFVTDNDGAIRDNVIEAALGPDLSEVSAAELIECINTEEGSSAEELLERLSARELLDRLGKDDLTRQLEQNNFINAANTASRTKYLRMCRKYGYDSHPARFPKAIPEVFVNLLTQNPEEEDCDRSRLDRPVVLDIFAGSNVTGLVAEQQEGERYHLGFEENPSYVETSYFRFHSEDEIRDWLGHGPVNEGADEEQSTLSE